MHVEQDKVELVLLAMPNHGENMFATAQLKESGYTGPIAAIAKYADEEELLQKAGVDSTFNMYAEVGTGFAQHSMSKLIDAPVR